MPSEELSLNELDAEITSSGGNFSLHKLTDGDFTNAELLPFNPFDKYGWIEYSFPKPQTIRALSFVSGRLRTEWRSESPQTVNFLQCSDNGVDYRMVVMLSKPYLFRKQQHVISGYLFLILQTMLRVLKYQNLYYTRL